ncbi:Na+-transporting NADH:ubiquinone oxidoreductase subunit B [Dysgonomonas alginatilytica]|uniref:Na(+)-translocating NADH-quinone reductase subunit B n=1 Tax=Dysgonomonas alginatilytica TaxID=1605892 RepID=A0A2V3PRR8_9BACT|nr:NADH:ubiquinone reductase (Na(+)-transporting) subunit B [Dysgonomonas alginatilytica]PXV65075.1 Na+-transporting NADH:ubiquinone oxidoreductase subunit B [Dysgonomonas alginatilytica]
MKSLRNQLDNRIKPHFEKGGKFEKLHSLYDAVDTFLYVPNTTSKSGVHIHDASDTKRTMSLVILALIPALLFGMYNVGYQHYQAIGEVPVFWNCFLFGLLAILPKIVVSYVVGLGIEIIIAQIKGHEVQEGFLVSGMLIPMIVPVDLPLWMLAVATAFAVVFAKEVFGGTGYNIFNVALVARAFLFFAYPSKMTGEHVFVRAENSFGVGDANMVDGITQTVDAFSGATPLSQIETATGNSVTLVDVTGHVLTYWDMFLGLIPGSIGETSKLAILIGAIIMILFGVASWKTMVSVFIGGMATALLINQFAVNAVMQITPLEHILLGGFAFGAVFMATDPVTSARTESGKWVYGFLIGVIAVLIRVFNPGYPEGMMLAILFMNAFAPLIDYVVVGKNIKRRMRRATQKNDKSV